jgi:hypothetical protein
VGLFFQGSAPHFPLCPHLLLERSKDEAEDVGAEPSLPEHCRAEQSSGAGEIRRQEAKSSAEKGNTMKTREEKRREVKRREEKRREETRREEKKGW